MINKFKLIKIESSVLDSPINLKFLFMQLNKI